MRTGMHEAKFKFSTNSGSSSLSSNTSTCETNGGREYLMMTDDQLISQCEMNTFKSSGPGGQHRNKRESAVRLKHLPTSIIAQVHSHILESRIRVLLWCICVNKLQSDRLWRIDHNTKIVLQPLLACVRF